MTAMHQLQLWLRDTDRYHGEIDGDYGRETRGACLAAMEDGPDTQLTDQDYRSSAAASAVKESAVRAFAEVEANGAGFFDGKPKILFEPHVFARLTQARFNDSNPTVSYSKLGRPSLPADAGRPLCSAARGGRARPHRPRSAPLPTASSRSSARTSGGAATTPPWAFAEPGLRRTVAAEGVRNVPPRTGIVTCCAPRCGLRRRSAYNGPAYAKNRYDVKLAMAARAWAQRLGE
jgi:hypothetical protein